MKSNVLCVLAINVFNVNILISLVGVVANGFASGSNGPVRGGGGWGGEKSVGVGGVLTLLVVFTISLDLFTYKGTSNSNGRGAARGATTISGARSASTRMAATTRVGGNSRNGKPTSVSTRFAALGLPSNCGCRISSFDGSSGGPLCNSIALCVCGSNSCSSVTALATAAQGVIHDRRRTIRGAVGLYGLRACGGKRSRVNGSTRCNRGACSAIRIAARCCRGSFFIACTGENTSSAGKLLIGLRVGGGGVGTSSPFIGRLLSDLGVIVTWGFKSYA